MLGDDGLPLDEVGPWAKEKHERLGKYVDICRAVRRKFVQRGNAATYIDLYCGSGRAKIRDTGEVIDGSPLVAFKAARDGGVPFSEFYVADADEQKCRATRERLSRVGGRPVVEIGPAEQTVTRVAERLSPYGFHFAFLDPNNLEDLPFSVIERLSRFKYMDMLIHVSAQDLQRNLDNYAMAGGGPLDEFAPGWRNAVDLKQTKSATRADVIAYWAARIEALGLPRSKRAPLIRARTKNQRLYWLVLVGRHERAREFWDKVQDLSGQGELPL
jgi:three-Cys-motif partner protein